MKYLQFLYIEGNHREIYFDINFFPVSCFNPKRWICSGVQVLYEWFHPTGRQKQIQPTDRSTYQLTDQLTAQLTHLPTD